MRSFLLLALLGCASWHVRAQDLPSAPSALGQSMLIAVTPGQTAAEASAGDHELALAVLDLPIRSIADHAEAVSADRPFALPLIAPVPSRPAKVMDRDFLLMIGAGTALTVIDYEMTLSCLSRRVCREANPLVPTSRAGMYASNLPLNALLYYWSYKRKASGKRLWWVAPMVIIGSHAVGVASNVPFVGMPARK